MRVNLLPGIKSVQLELHNISFLKSPKDYPLRLGISDGLFSIIIGIVKKINKEHIRLSKKKGTCCSATFGGFPVGTDIKAR